MSCMLPIICMLYVYGAYMNIGHTEYGRNIDTNFMRKYMSFKKIAMEFVIGLSDKTRCD